MPKSNVVPFSVRPGATAIPANDPHVRPERGPADTAETTPAHSLAQRFGFFLVDRLLRGAVFFVLRFLRPIVVGACCILAYVGLFALLVIALGYDASHQKNMWMLWIGGTAFAAFLVQWYYDVALSKLQREPIIFN